MVLINFAMDSCAHIGNNKPITDAQFMHKGLDQSNVQLVNSKRNREQFMLHEIINISVHVICHSSSSSSSSCISANTGSGCVLSNSNS